MLVEKELEILSLLGEAYNTFNHLPKSHPQEQDEFITAIHAAQRIVMARSAIRSHPSFFVMNDQ